MLSVITTYHAMYVKKKNGPAWNMFELTKSYINYISEKHMFQNKMYKLFVGAVPLSLQRKDIWHQQMG